MKAYEAGCAEATWIVGRCFCQGVGTQQDEEKSRQMAKAGDALAMAEVALQNQRLRDSVLKPLVDLAHRGQPLAQYNLALCYFNGFAASEDMSAAVQLWRSAAQVGHAEAQFWLGRCFADGTGVPFSDSQAALWFSATAAQGHQSAQAALVDEPALMKLLYTDATKQPQWPCEVPHSLSRVPSASCLGGNTAARGGQVWSRQRERASAVAVDALQHRSHCDGQGKFVGFRCV